MPIWSQWTGKLLSQKTETVDSDLSWTQYTWQMGTDTVRMQVLVADLRGIHIGLVLARDQVIGQETVSSMVARTGALAGVNGGFSFSNDPWNNYHGDPRDLLVRGGRLLSEPLSTRSSFALIEADDRQVPVFDQFTWEGYLRVGADTLRLTGVNRVRDSADVLLYTPEYNRTTLTDPSGLEFACRQNRCTLLSGGSNPIPADGFILSLAADRAGAWRERLSDGEVSLVQRLRAQRYPDLDPVHIWTAGPTLLRQGKLALDWADESIKPSFGSTRHPRTAVGYDPEQHRLWLVVVDGRQPGWSTGIRLDDLAHFFQYLGASEAYNLDGGGSSTMVIGDRVVNRFSDPRERRRCDAVVLFPRSERH